jgi:3-oxoacyl-[acyl-carrier protein] reductase
MPDRFLQISRNPTARKFVTTLGLPIPLPEPLERDRGPLQERPLFDRAVVVGGAGALGATLADALCRAGANPFLVGLDPAPWTAAGEAWGRPPVTLEGEAMPERRPYALVFDATGLEKPEDLRRLYDFFHPRVRGVARSGRVVLLARPHVDTKEPATAAARRAVEGFVRSLAKEVGRGGATAQLVIVPEGTEDRLAPVLRFLLSPRSAYVSGQVLRLSRTVKLAEDKAARPLSGKTALVTGAARGIGAATARALAREGAKVVVLDRPADDAQAAAVAAEIGGLVCLADLSDPDAAAQIAAFVKAQLGQLDVLVHNAGVTRDKMLANMKESWWEQAIDVNLAAVLRTQEALEPLLASNARTVCLSSIAGLAGNLGQTNYAASKAGVVGLVEGMAPKVARKGGTINAIAPGFIETRLTDAIPVATREVARRLCNLSQGGQPEDVAEAILFLASPGSAGLNGQVLRVCGGSLVGA